MRRRVRLCHPSEVYGGSGGRRLYRNSRPASRFRALKAQGSSRNVRALSLDNVPSRPFRLGDPQVAATSGERLRLSLQWQAGPQARVGRSMSRPPTPSFSFGDQHRLSNQASAVVDHNAHHLPAARWLPVTAVSSVRLASDQRQRTDGDEPRRGERGAIPNDVRRFVRPTRNRDRWPTLLPNRQRMS
jgi:hypothetical protein